MAALTLTIALFVYLTAVGAGLLAWVPAGTRVRRHLTLAPAIGVAFTLLATFWLNQLGLPVQSFATPLALVLLLPAAVALALRRPPLPWRAHRAFALPVALGLAVVAPPMLAHGFDWISFGNDDMANYVLAAHRFAHHGFYDIPDVTAMTANTESPLGYWFMHVLDGSRCGAELLLAMTLSVTHRTAPEIFMPLIVCLNLVLVSAAGAMLPHRPRHLSRGLITSLLVACSALSVFGLLYQLIGQVLGLGLLCAIIAVNGRGPMRMGDIAIGAALSAALIIGYPEVLPFLLAEMGALALWMALRRRRLLRGALKAWAIMGAVSLLLVAPAMLPIIDYLHIQISTGSNPKRGSLLFPYYLIPSGLANACGLIAVAKLPVEPWLSLGIASGAAIIALVCIISIRGATRGLCHALMGLTVLALAAWLFARGVGFGLYKIAMYAQPFGAAALAAAAVSSRRRWPWALMLTVLAVLNLTVARAYVTKSQGDVSSTGAGFVEIPYASSMGLLHALAETSKRAPAPVIMSDSTNIVLYKLQSLYFGGRPFYDATFGENLTYFSWNSINGIMPQWLFPRRSALVSAGIAIFQAMDAQLRRSTFDLHATTRGEQRNPFLYFTPAVTERDKAAGIVLVSGPAQTILNRGKPVADPKTCFTSVSAASISNQLLFAPSEMGQENYYGRREHVALYQMEPDPMRAGQLFAGLGRIVLFSVMNPTPTMRLRLDFTRTLAHDNDNALPPAVVIGSQRTALPLVGRGSARVVSPSFTPQVIDGTAFVGLDLGIEGRQFASERSGLMRLYGTQVVLDPRQLVAFGRDISLISDAEYAATRAPDGVTLPTGLADTALEYSGIYEDGWTSEHAVLRLTPPPQSTRLRVSGMVPLIGNAAHETRLTVRVNGRPVATQVLRPGDFTVTAETGALHQTSTVELEFSAFQHLPDPDGRPAAGLLREVRFIR